MEVRSYQYEPQYPPPPPLSFPTPGKMVPCHPLGDGHQVTVPHHPPGDRSTAVHAHCGAQKLRQKTKQHSIRNVGVQSVTVSQCHSVAVTNESK